MKQTRRLPAQARPVAEAVIRSTDTAKPFAALAAALHTADVEAAKRLKRSAPLRANRRAA